MSYFWRQFADPEFQLKLSVALGMIALQCLVAIWAATSSRHWFWRALAVWAAIMLMAPIRAWEPAWMFGLSSPLIVIMIALGQRWGPREPAPADLPLPQSRPSRWRFSLLDLLLLMVVVGLCIHGAKTVVWHYQPRNWIGWLASSVGLAMLAAVSYACARTPRRWLDVALVCAALIEFEAAYALGYPFTGLIAAGAALAAYGCAFDWRHWIALFLLICIVPISAMAVASSGVWMRTFDPLNLAEGAGFWNQTLVMTLLGAEIASLLIIVLGLVRATRSAKLWLPWRIIVGCALTLVLSVTLLHVGRAYFGLWRRTLPLAPVAQLDLPGNNYYRILGIASEIGLIHPAAKSWQSSQTTKPNAQMAQALKVHYRELFALLAGQNHVPYDPQQDAIAEYEYGNAGKWGARWTVIRELMNSLNAEADWAIETKQPSEAANVALALIRFGDMQSRGGVWIDYSFGIHFRRTGYAKLAQVRADLPPDRLGTLIRDLQHSLDQREDTQALRLRQEDFQEKSYGWGRRLNAVFDKNSYDAQIDSYEQSNPAYDELDITLNKLFQADLAIRQFQQDEGRLPESLADVVPKYLPTLPLDARRHPLRYRPESGQFVLYSIGADDRDDGGKFGELGDYYRSHPSLPANPQLPPPPPFDLDLDTLARP